MHSWHAKSRCCRAKIYHFGSRHRRQCSQCKRTWRIRKKRAGRKRHRMRAGALKAVFVDARTLKTLAQRYGLTRQGLSWRFRGRSATVHIAVSELSLAERTVGFGLGRTLLSLSKKRLGFVCDGDQTLPSKSSHLPRSGAAQRQREHAGLVPRLHNHSVFDTQAYSRLGLRRGFRYYQARYNPGLGRSALPFSSHQSIAELPRPTQSQTACKSAARGALPTDPPSSRASRWPSAPIRAHATQASRCAGKTIACHAHDRSRVSQTGRSFQSLSEISKIKSANYYGAEL